MPSRSHPELGSLLRGADGFGFELEVGEYLFAAPGQNLAALLAELHPEGRPPPADLLGVWQHASRLDAMQVAMQRAGTWEARHPWLDLFLPSSVAHAVISHALAELCPEDLVDGHVMTYPLSRTRQRAPLIALPDEPDAFLFDILPSVRSAQVARGARLEQASARILRQARGLGASVYPIGFPIGTSEMTSQHWREQLGDRWAAFEASKRRHDPDRLLTPGPGVFEVGG